MECVDKGQQRLVTHIPQPPSASDSGTSADDQGWQEIPQCWRCAEHPPPTQIKDRQTVLTSEAAQHILVAAKCKVPHYLLQI